MHMAPYNNSLNIIWSDASLVGLHPLMNIFIHIAILIPIVYNKLLHTVHIASLNNSLNIMWRDAPSSEKYLHTHSDTHTLRLTGPSSAVGNVSGYRCVSDCRSRGPDFDLGPVPYFRENRS